LFTSIVSRNIENYCLSIPFWDDSQSDISLYYDFNGKRIEKLAFLYPDIYVNKKAFLGFLSMEYRVVK
jgi:hypothetical protein